MNKIGKTGIIPFTYFLGKQKPVGSTFLRVDSLCLYSPNFEKWIHGKKYDNLIFQKAYWKEMMELFEGPRILDLCDPDWLRKPLDIIKYSHLVHAITCSSMELTKLLEQYLPEKLVVHVPDRINPRFFPSPRKKHVGRAKDIVWFGYIKNAHETLNPLFSVIKEHKMDLKIISNEPYSRQDDILYLNPTFIKYDQKTAYERIKEADIVLNPKSSKAFFKYKSQNKNLISWKLGVPVAVSSYDVELLLDPEERNKQVMQKQLIVENEFHIRNTEIQYRAIFSHIIEQDSMQKQIKHII